MQGGEGEVTCFGDRQRCGDRLQVAHFTDQNDVGVFAQRVLQCVGERFGVAAYFALIDDAALVFVNEFDRIFDRDDMAFALAVDLVDHCGKGRRFTGAGRTSY